VYSRFFLALIPLDVKPEVMKEINYMRQRARAAEKVRNLALPFQQQLTSYALAATAAGVSILALASPSEGKIVYKQAHRVIGDGASFNLDLAGDGTVDLTIVNQHHHHCTTDGFCSSTQFLNAKMAGANQVVYNVYGAVAMKPGMQIGAKNVWRGGLQNMAVMLGSFGTSGVGGSWVNVKNRYLGVKFDIKGQTHFGWVRLNVQVQIPQIITATLTGYAYETVANQAITAGQTKGTENTNIEQPDAALTTPSPAPATLAALALGTPGLSIWRRKESVGDRQ
jgi:hypothetical protein